MLGRRIKGSIMRTWTFPKKLSLLAAVAAMAVLMTTASVAAQSAPQQDFFGVLISIGEDALVIRTGGQDVEVPITQDTLIRLPRTPKADLTNLEVGDVLAISREEVDGRLVTDKIFLIPGKTRHRHVPGIVLSITDAQIVIQPRREGAEPIAFSITPDTVVRSREGAPEVAEGTFVIVGAVRDLVTGQLKPNALAITVPKRPPGREAVQARPEVPEVQPANRAKIRGVFKGVDESGACIIDAWKLV
ncbi:MAG: hypothetical protein IH870_09180, partial [Chloroflexi bacterium]|nr:hypothetical protein [Chloroflexota bacterium]